MSWRLFPLLLVALILQTFSPPTHLSAQEPPPPPGSLRLPSNAPAAAIAAVLPPRVQLIVVPMGTRMPLILRNGINTRTAKPGDSVYFETNYPIAVNNRIIIPIVSFVRGELLESKRPGRIKGRGEFRMVLNQITFPNGYTVALAATPNSADRDGKEGVDPEGKIKGRSNAGRDVGLVLATTAGGAYIGTLSGAAIADPAGKGAAIGAGFGAAAGLLAVLVTRGPEAELPVGTTLDVLLDRPLLLDADHLPANEPGKLSSLMLPPQHDVQRQAERQNGLPLRSLLPLMRF
jgi:hypothetical protein